MTQSLTSPHPFDDTALELSNEQQVTFAWISMICGMIWALHLVLASRGVLHGDALSHFVMSREAWRHPTLMLDHWGRPVQTIFYMVPALFGLVYARLASLILAALTVVMTFVLARQLRVKYAFVVPALLWFQPWFLKWASQPSMTEIPFSLMMVLSASLLVSNRVVLASVVIGLFPLVRIEALALTTLWVAVCLWRRTWYGVIIASIPIIIYGVLYHAVFGHLPDDGFPLNPLLVLAGHVPHVPHPASWRITHWFIYPYLLVLGAGLPLAALAVYGIPRLIATPVRLAVLAWYGTYAAMHVVLYRLGIEGWAEDRYWLPLAPVVAIAGAVGLEIMAGRIRTWITRRRGFGVSSARLSKLILALAITAAVVSGLFVSPTPADPAEDAARAALAWLRQERLTDAPILSASSVWFLYLSSPRYGPAGMKATPPSDWPRGSIAVWDNEYSDDWGVSWAVLSSDHKWKMLKTFEVGNDRVVVFQKELP